MGCAFFSSPDTVEAPGSLNTVMSKLERSERRMVQVEERASISGLGKAHGIA
jgi:hypothetical protein